MNKELFLSFSRDLKCENILLDDNNVVKISGMLSVFSKSCSCNLNIRQNSKSRLSTHKKIFLVRLVGVLVFNSPFSQTDICSRS